MRHLGVAVGSPVQLPGMIPMWMFGIAIATGNTFILKPSEKDPTLPVKLAELMMEAGAPSGVLNVVHGDKAAVDAILDHPDIKAVSFVGSSDIAHYVYSHGTAAGKRVQAMGGAKNHGLILPDADLEQATKDIIGAAYGSAGERCMALPVVVPVGKKTADEVRERVLAEIDTLKVGLSNDPAAQCGPVVTQAHKDKIASYISLGVEEGRAGGRRPQLLLQGYEKGLHRSQPVRQREAHDEDLPGGDLRAGPADRAHRELRGGDRAALPTSTATASPSSPATAAPRSFAARVNVGMVGINVPIPVPVAYHSSAAGSARPSATPTSTAWKACASTPRSTITARWPEGAVEDSAFVILTMR
jgi:malonate-semialdehyde dehydrogenase (acetylating)/methylmalonate-semialdehyde dehydrogenase